MIDPTVLRELCEQATPGPWVCDFPEVFRVEPKSKNGPTAIVWEYPNEGGGLSNEADGKFIAAAREALPQLLDENAALRERVKELAENVHERDTRHARYLEEVEEVLGPIRQRRYTGEPSRSDREELRDMKGRMLYAEFRLAALKEAGEKVVEASQARGDPRYCRFCEGLPDHHIGVCPLDAFSNLLRSDP